MKKILGFMIAGLIISTPIVANAEQIGFITGSLNNHRIKMSLYGYASIGEAKTILDSCYVGSSCKDGLYTYIEGLDSNGNRIKAGVEEYEYNTSAGGYVTQTVSRAVYFSSRHKVLYNESKSGYLQVKNGF